MPTADVSPRDRSGEKTRLQPTPGELGETARLSEGFQRFIMLEKGIIGPKVGKLATYPWLVGGSLHFQAKQSIGQLAT